MQLLRKMAPWDNVKKDDIRVGIQKRDGHLYKLSTAFLRNLSSVADDVGVKGKELSSINLRWGETATLLTSRLEDVVENVAAGRLDLGIVSDDVLRKWSVAEKETVIPRTITRLADIGPAGSKLMLGIDIDFICEAEKNPSADVFGDAPNRSLKKAFRASKCRELPIITSDKPALCNYLMKNNLCFTAKDILERRGTVEAQGRMMGSLIICDLVESGDTMQSYNYRPVSSAVISQSRMILIGNVPREPEERATRFWRFADFASTCSVPV